MTDRQNDNDSNKPSPKLVCIIKDIVVASTLVFALLLAAWALTSG